MVEIPVVAGAPAPSSGSRAKGTPAAIAGDDATPRDPPPTMRDDAPGPMAAGADRADRAGGAGGARGTPVDDHDHHFASASGRGGAPPDPSRLTLDDTTPTTAPGISDTESATTTTFAATAAASGPHPPSPKPPWRWHPSRRRPDETDADARWLARRKHFFILSDAGKPIYSRYGDVASLAGFTAALSAIAAAASTTSTSTTDGDEVLRSVSVGARHEMVFLSRGPVYLVALAATGESPGALRRQLCLLHAQFLSVLTDAVERALRRSSRFDARELLGGTDAAFGTLAHAFTWDPATFLGAWAPAPFPHASRRAASNACRAAMASRAAAAAGAHAALLATTHHVITLVTPARRATAGAGQCAMDPDDALVLLNFARSSESFRRNPENFAPVCLPRFRPSAFAHAYVAYLEPEVVLVLVATRSDAFFALRDARVALEATLRREGVLERAARLVGGDGAGGDGVGGGANLANGTTPTTTPTTTSPTSGEETKPAAVRAANPGGGERRPGSVCVATQVPRGAGGGPPGRRPLLHFLYSRPPLGQYVAPDWAAPLDDRAAQKRLLRAYARVFEAMRAPADGEWADDGGAGAGPGAGGGAGAGGGGGAGAEGGGFGAGGMATLGAFLSGGSFGGGFAGALGGTTRAAQPPRRRVHYEATDERVLLACSGSDFEVCVALDPLTDESTAVGVCNRLCTWLRQQEHRLFVTQ